MPEVINLDCSFRDGGYYNNWSFSQSDINLYLKNISKTKIRFVEIGFRFYDKKNSGLTAYSNDKFLNKLKFDKKIKIGVMINASDFIINNKIDYKILNKVFPHCKNLSFIRVAFHAKDLNYVKKIRNFFYKFKIKFILNLMQVSELRKRNFIEIINEINLLNIEAFYIADSFGSLKPSDIHNFSKILKKYCTTKIGFHAHDNLGLAFKNALEAIKVNFDYLDSTILGMGRGAGNLKTEEIYKHLFKKDIVGNKSLKIINERIFKKLKKNYKWGTNTYYRYAANKSIHPSYVQELISNDIYKKKNYFKILQSLAKIDSRKYNPKNLVENNRKKIFKLNINKIKLNKSVLILGSSPNLKLYKDKIRNFSLRKNLSNIAINLNNTFDNDFIDYRVASHPRRIQIDCKFYNKYSNKFILPLNVINSKITAKINFQNSKYFNYGIEISNNEKIFAKKDKCILPNYLSLGYALSLVISKNIKKIYLAGFEGFSNDDYAKDESNNLLRMFKKKFKKIKIISITPTKFNLKYLKLK